MGIFGKRIYLDHAGATPLDSRVFSAMKPFLQGKFANSASVYREGVEVKRAISSARESISKILMCRSEEIIFVGSGTEANNLALLGIFRSAKRQLRGKVPHIITSKVEHSSVLEACRAIEEEGGRVTYMEVPTSGRIDPKRIEQELTPETILVSIMYANNEIGTIQDLGEIARIVRRFRKNKGDAEGYPYFHTDAAQAPNYLSLRTDSLGIDLMTIDASKIYGPKGVAVLFVKKSVPIQPIIFGGGQEKGFRSGTENAAAIVGMEAAFSLAISLRESESVRLKKIRDYFFSEIRKRIRNARPNGSLEWRLPNNVNICFPGLNAEFAVIELDQAGIAAASASACLNLSKESTSYVIGEVSGIECARSSLRFTMGRGTKKKDIDRTVAVLERIIHS